MIEVRIKQNDQNKRLDHFVRKYLNNAPLSFIYKLFRKKDIKVNKKPAKPDYITKLDDLIYIFNDDPGIMNSEFDYVVNLDTEVTDQMVKPFADGVTALDERDQENAGYFNQDMELDAFAYSYAVMKYKYGTIPYLYIPQAYQNDTFDAIVNDWVNTFLEEGL